MKIIKKISLFMVVCVLFFSHVIKTHAENEPTFDTLPAISVTENSAIIRGRFHSELTDSFPLIWFQYGTDASSLNKRTDDVVETKQDVIYTQLISGLEPETKYYFRTVLELNSYTYYGDILSFVTNAIHTGHNIENVHYGSGNANDVLNQMLKDYNTTLSQSVQNKNVSDDNVSNYVDDGHYSFFDFFKWFFKKRNDKVTHSNLVHSEEEIREVEKEKQKRLELLSEQKKYSNSAYEDDEWGEVVQFNSYQQRQNKSNASWVPFFFFILLLLLVLLLVFKMYLLRKKRMNTYRQNMMELHGEVKDGHTRYYIPVKRDLHDPIQNPNPEANPKNDQTTFFRRKNKK